MVGGLVLKECLDRDDVRSVTAVTRRKTGLVNPKLREIVHENFLDYSEIGEYFREQDVGFYCIGVYSGSVPAGEFRTITVDYAKAFAEALQSHSPHAAFCFLSGQGADSTEKSRIPFARDKGKAENILLGLGFERIAIFRPGYIYPVTPRKEPNFGYRMMRVLYKPVISRLLPNAGIPSEDLAEAMVEIGLDGGGHVIYENKDIRKFLIDHKQ